MTRYWSGSCRVCSACASCIRSFSTSPTPADGLQHNGGGWSYQRSNSLSVHACSVDKWSFKPTTGPAQPWTGWWLLNLFVWVVVYTRTLVVMMGLLTSMTSPNLISWVYPVEQGSNYKYVVSLLGMVTVELSEWRRELCAALEDTSLVPHKPGPTFTRNTQYSDGQRPSEYRVPDVALDEMRLMSRRWYGRRSEQTPTRG